MRHVKAQIRNPDNRPRRRVPALAWPRAVVGIFALTLLLSSLFVPWKTWGESWLESCWATLVRTTVRHGFVIDDVLIEGRHYVDPDDVRNAIRLRRGDPILLDTPAAIKKRLEDLPWVRAAAVQRIIPNLIYVRLAERRPVAIWQNKGKLFLIDGENKLIDSENVGTFRDLPLVVGAGAVQVTSVLLQLLKKFPRIKQEMSAAIRVSERRWDLKFKNGIKVHLPEQNVAETFTELDKQIKNGLLQKEVLSVDLRLPDRWVFSMPQSLAVGTQYHGKSKMKKV